MRKSPALIDSNYVVLIRTGDLVRNKDIVKIKANYIPVSKKQIGNNPISNLLRNILFNFVRNIAIKKLSKANPILNVSNNNKILIGRNRKTHLGGRNPKTQIDIACKKL